MLDPMSPLDGASEGGCRNKQVPGTHTGPKRRRGMRIVTSGFEADESEMAMTRKLSVVILAQVEHFAYLHIFSSQFNLRGESL